MEQGYTAAQTAKITGVPYATLDYYERSKFLVPSVRPASGSGRARRLYSFSDLVRLRVVRELRGQNVPLQTIRKVVTKLRSLRPPRELADSRLVVVGNRVHLVGGPDELVELMSGQRIFSFVVANVGLLYREVEATAKDVRDAA